MKGSLVLLLALSVSVLGASFANAAEESLLGDGCYHIPTSSTLVKVLVGAEEKNGTLVSQLTSGEIWVLKAFFSLAVTEAISPEDIEMCMRTS